MAPNIIISSNGEHAIFVGFDWVAKQGGGFYPATINGDI